jgi:hypothetical protein
MGASQSSSPSDRTASHNESTVPASHNNQSSSSTSSSSSSRSKDDSSNTNSNNLSGMALVNHKCAKKKFRYDKCSSDFYQKEFLTGKSLSQADACSDKFDAYRECVLKGIKIEIWDKQNMPPLKEGSPLLEVMDVEERKK